MCAVCSAYCPVCAFALIWLLWLFVVVVVVVVVVVWQNFIGRATAPPGAPRSSYGYYFDNPEACADFTRFLRNHDARKEAGVVAVSRGGR